MVRSLLIVASLVSVAAADRVAPDASTGWCVPQRGPVAKGVAIKAPRCHKASAVLQKAIRADIAKTYFPTRTGGKPGVTFPCDGLGPQIREITLETGGGHGGSLQLWHARRAGAKFDVHGLLYQDGAKGSVTIASGTASLPDLERVRAALTAKLKEIVPPPKPGTIGGYSGSSNSRDFRVLIHLVDDDGRVVEREYTGYESSGEQDAYLGLELARDGLAPILALEGKADPPTADDRDFFSVRFNAAVPSFGEQYHWWVMERFVGMARFVGSAAVIDGLVSRLTVTKPDRSKVDARADAVEALGIITGWDATDGGKKTVEQAAASYLAECRP